VRVGIYARVSTVGNGQSPEMQLRELREYVERRGWTLAGEYVDEGISGAKDSRPELNRLVEDAHRRKFDCSLSCLPDVLVLPSTGCIPSERSPTLVQTMPFH
jgi:DNA invertase Pin-like site-specific DNA recombinase